MLSNEHFLARGPLNLFRPDEDGARGRHELRIVNRLAALVGLVAFGLPVTMLSGALIGGGELRDSISHFYYAPFLGAVFVGMLAFIGGFMIAYCGEHWLEDLGSTIAGFGAIFVALFPTSGTGIDGMAQFPARVFAEVTRIGDGPVSGLSTLPDGGYFLLFDGAPNLHSYAAAALFFYLALYCLVVLKRVIPGRHVVDGRLIASKRRRNVIYSLCGLAILFSIAILGLVWWRGRADPDFLVWWNGWNGTFAVETLALWAFGLAWMLKGRTIGALND